VPASARDCAGTMPPRPFGQPTSKHLYPKAVPLSMCSKIFMKT
jgi:hypothetical protein